MYVYTCMGMHMPRYACGDWRTTCTGEFSPSTIQILGIKLISIGNRHLYLLSHPAGAM